jgi:uncharacterized sulfatase
MPRFIFLLLLLAPLTSLADDRPNILWISCEDISPRLGCYGDPQATTPHLDRLAAEGVRFTQAHHVHGVCAPARTGIITAMYPTSLGCNHMRCKGLLPAHVKPFPQYMKQAGYYCTNNSKTDYNFHWTTNEVWNDSSKTAHWRNRPHDDTPFFAVFNITLCHESGVWERNHPGRTKALAKDQFHDPAKMKLPAYYPDTPKARASMARLYDVITAMDIQAGKILSELEEDGLADETIVIFWSDHGDGLPRAKRWIYDSGTRVPMIVRIPEKFRTGGFGEPNSVDHRLVSMIDLGPTALRLAGIDIPEHMRGQPFIGQNLPAERKYVYAARDRIDERYDMVRMVRDDRYRYMRTYMTWYPTLRLINYAENNAIRQEMRRLLAEGSLKPEAAQFLAPTRPYEQLYDTQIDPDEVKNLVDHPEYADILKRLRGECDRWMLDVRDAQLVAEPFLEDADAAAGNRRSVVAGQDGKTRVKRLMNVAAVVAQGGDVDTLLEYLGDEDPAVRWWAAMGLGNDPAVARQNLPTLQKAMADESTAVQVAAARAVDQAGKTDQALPVLAAALKGDNGATRLWAITVLDEMDERARPVIDAIQEATKKQPNNYVTRVAQTALAQLNE